MSIRSYVTHLFMRFYPDYALAMLCLRELCQMFRFTKDYTFVVVVVVEKHFPNGIGIYWPALQICGNPTPAFTLPKIYNWQWWHFSAYKHCARWTVVQQYTNSSIFSSNFSVHIGWVGWWNVVNHTFFFSYTKFKFNYRINHWPKHQQNYFILKKHPNYFGQFMEYER